VYYRFNAGEMGVFVEVIHVLLSLIHFFKNVIQISATFGDPYLFLVVASSNTVGGLGVSYNM
jgi:hypothetical protein